MSTAIRENPHAGRRGWEPDGISVYGRDAYLEDNVALDREGKPAAPLALRGALGPRGVMT